MKKNLIKNSLFILSFLILVIILLFHSKQFYDWKVQNDKSEYEFYQNCLELRKSNVELYEERRELCEMSKKNMENGISFYYAYLDIVNGRLGGTVGWILFLFVAIPGLYFVSYYLKNNVIKNDIMRISYKKIISKLFKESYKAIFIIPMVVFFGFIICYFITGDFGFDYFLISGGLPWEDSTMSCPLLFIVVTLLQVLLLSIVYINICLWIVRKHHNYFIAVILSYLTFLGLDAFLEIVFTVVVGKFFNTDVGIIVNIINVFYFRDTFGVVPMISFLVIMVIFTSLAVYFRYRKKEDLIIDCEKNV